MLLYILRIYWNFLLWKFWILEKIYNNKYTQYIFGLMSEFEKRLQEKIIEIKNPDKTQPQNVLGGTKILTKKQKLVEQYIEVKLEYLEKFDKLSFQKFKKEHELDLEKLKKRIYKIKNSELEKELAEMMAKIINIPQSSQSKAGGEALFQLQVIICKALEETTQIIDSQIDSGDRTISLKGLTKDNIENEEILKPILQDIYDEYHLEIDEYLTPWARLSMAYFQIAAARLAKNNTAISDQTELATPDVKK